MVIPASVLSDGLALQDDRIIRLLSNLAADDFACLELVMTLSAPLLMRYSAFLVLEQTPVEYVTDKTFAYAFESRSSYVPEKGGIAYLLRICRSFGTKTADCQRRDAKCPTSPRLVEAIGADPRPADGYMQLLKANLSRLHPDEEEMLYLRFGLGLDYGRIGSIVGRDEVSVRAVVHGFLRETARLLKKQREKDTWDRGD